MQGRKTSLVVHLTAEQLAELEHGQRSPSVPAGVARRGRLILLMNQRSSLSNAARIAGLTVRNARKWVRRFLEQGTDGLTDRSRPGRKPVFSPQRRPPSGQNGLRATG
jgi:leucine-zipper of insertion element IS481